MSRVVPACPDGSPARRQLAPGGARELSNGTQRPNPSSSRDGEITNFNEILYLESVPSLGSSGCAVDWNPRRGPKVGPPIRLLGLRLAGRGTEVAGAKKAAPAAFLSQGGPIASRQTRAPSTCLPGARRLRRLNQPAAGPQVLSALVADSRCARWAMPGWYCTSTWPAACSISRNDSSSRTRRAARRSRRRGGD